MKATITITIESKVAEIFEKTCNDDLHYKTCPYCGQSKIPFKMGVCICGAQVGKIQYVNDPQRIVNQYYTYVGDDDTRTEKLGISELMDN